VLPENDGRKNEAGCWRKMNWKTCAGRRPYGARTAGL